jgi:predicted secreted Zn-dependent protease
MSLFKFNWLKLSAITALALVVLSAVLVINNSRPLISQATAATAAAGSQVVSGGTASAGSAVPNPAPAVINRATPSCGHASYTPPATPSVSTMQPGLHSSLNDSNRYVVYGNNVAEVKSQMAACSPVNDADGGFAATTDSSISWTFDVLSDGSTCHVTQASVGINVSTVYPAWQPTAGAEASLPASWQRFVSNLAVHENGHVQLDLAGAQQILAELQNYTAADCDSLISAANASANADLARLEQANATYDTATNHGATQGATLN